LERGCGVVGVHNTTWMEGCGIVVVIVAPLMGGHHTLFSYGYEAEQHGCANCKKSNDAISLYTLKTINYRSLVRSSVLTRTIQHSYICGHTLSLFVGVINVGQVKVLFHHLEEITTGLWFIDDLIFR